MKVKYKKGQKVYIVVFGKLAPVEIRDYLADSHYSVKMVVESRKDKPVFAVAHQSKLYESEEDYIN